ncbi:MAG: O-antigen ligase family protein [Minwuia sp.]|uniref:O-antigen ligase family protein n=1 Tax=Minwuia sp. TaxID=2493630 RepID=UPI003A887774
MVSLAATGKGTQLAIAAGFSLFVFGALTGFAHPVVPVALGLLPVVLLGALRQACMLGILFVAFSFFRLHEVVPQLMPLKLPLLLALGVLGTLGWNLAFRRTKTYWDPLFTPFLLFFLIVTIGVFAGTNTGNAFGYWKDTYIKIAIMVFALAWLLRHPRDFAKLLVVMLGSATLVALVALQNKAAGIGLVEGTRVTIGRDIGSMLGDPNDLSLVLLFGAGWALGAADTKGLGRFARIAGVVVFVLIALAVVATQSRGGLLGIASVVGVFASRRIKSKLLLGSMGGLAMMVLFAVAGIDDRQSGGAHEEGIDESAMGRIYAWQAAMGMAVARPLFGVGVDNFLFNYYLYSPHWDGQNHAVHSTWFGVMAETGILGFLVFVTMVAALGISAWRVRNRLLADPDSPAVMRAAGSALVGGFAGFCVSGTFLTQGFVWPIYIMLALAIALRQYAATAADCSAAAASRSAAAKTDLQPVETQELLLRPTVCDAPHRTE